MAAQDPTQDISALAERLRVLPWGEAGVPAPLDEILDTGSRRRVDGGAGRVAFQLLAALGISGWSARLDLQSAVNTIRRTSQANGVYVRAWQALKQAGLYETHTAFFGRRPVGDCPAHRPGPHFAGAGGGTGHRLGMGAHRSQPSPG